MWSNKHFLTGLLVAVIAIILSLEYVGKGGFQSAFSIIFACVIALGFTSLVGVGAAAVKGSQYFYCGLYGFLLMFELSCGSSYSPYFVLIQFLIIVSGIFIGRGFATKYPHSKYDFYQD